MVGPNIHTKSNCLISFLKDSGLAIHVKNGFFSWDKKELPVLKE